jgi:hypothetical protein
MIKFSKFQFDKCSGPSKAFNFRAQMRRGVEPVSLEAVCCKLRHSLPSSQRFGMQRVVLMNLLQRACRKSISPSTTLSERSWLKGCILRLGQCAC